MARGPQSKTSDRDQDKDLPLWASIMLEKFIPSAERVEKALTLSLAKLTGGIEEVTRCQSDIIPCLDALEEPAEFEPSGSRPSLLHPRQSEGR
ncbi:hypothetical protein V3C99_017878 [Haemonchus contortus]